MPVWVGDDGGLRLPAPALASFAQRAEHGELDDAERRRLARMAILRRAGPAGGRVSDEDVQSWIDLLAIDEAEKEHRGDSVQVGFDVAAVVVRARERDRRQVAGDDKTPHRR
jgi:hypothetical protein